MKTPNLVQVFAVMKSILPRTRFSRWADFRLAFGDRTQTNWPAAAAIWDLKDCGPKTRDRWIKEYRHHRRLSGINRGMDYDSILYTRDNEF